MWTHAGAAAACLNFGILWVVFNVFVYHKITIGTIIIATDISIATRDTAKLNGANFHFRL